MVKDLYELSQGENADETFVTDTDVIVTSVDDTGKITWTKGVTNEPDQIFSYIAKYATKLEN